MFDACPIGFRVENIVVKGPPVLVTVGHDAIERARGNSGEQAMQTAGIHAEQ
jgi:hypothetical protein